MPKQEDVRDWINKYLTRRFICNPDELPDNECLNETNEILQYLVSQGMAIKREENPRYLGWFKLEPLIKEREKCLNG